MRRLFLSLAAAALLDWGGANAAAATTVTPAADVRVTVVIPLRYRHENELDALLTAQSDPHSPMYRHFLDARQFLSAFAPTAAQYAAAQGALVNAGFRLEQTFRNRCAIVASATPVDAERLFRAPMRETRTQDGSIVVTPLAPLRVPQALDADAVFALGGPETAGAARRLVAARPNAAPPGSSRPIPLYGPDGGFGPTLVSKALDFPTRHGYDGTGVHVANIVPNGLSAPHAVADFLQYFGIARNAQPGKARCAYGACSEGFVADQMTEWLVALAPGITLDDYSECTGLPACAIGNYNQIVSDDVADVVVDGNEFDEVQGGAVTAAVGRLMKQGTAMGMTFVTGVGDQGFAQGPQFVGTPADQQTAIAAGPSSVDTSQDGTILDEQGVGAPFVGPSLVIPMPPYQVSFFGEQARRHRLLPDVAVPVSMNGVAASTFAANAGSSPTWAQWLAEPINAYSYPALHQSVAGALVAEFAQMHKGRFGNLNATLYGLAGPAGYAKGLFRDITEGCTAPGNGPKACAQPGWDRLTGIGALGGYTLGKALQ